MVMLGLTSASSSGLTSASSLPSHGSLIDWKEIEWGKIKEESLEQLEKRIVSVSKKQWELLRELDDNNRETNQLRDELERTRIELCLIQCKLYPLKKLE